MSQYQAEPPITRVVLDLKAPQDFQLTNLGNKLIVKLRPLANRGTALAETGTPKVSSRPNKVATGESSTTIAASTPKRQDFVVVEPQYHEVTREQQAEQEKTAAERASDAAKVLGAAPPVEIPLSAGPTHADIKPQVVRAAMMQAAQGSAQAVNAAAAT